MNSQNKSAPRIVIIGGVAGGASAAARARRLSEMAQITLIERGPAVSFANCGLPYHMGGVIAERAKLLVQTPESLRARFNIEVRVNTEAVAIDRAARCVRIRNITTNEEESRPYDKVILSPGAAALRPPIPGLNSERVFTFQTLSDMDSVMARVKGGARRVAVIGGGFIGLEVAENLVHRGVGVVLVEAASQVFAPFDSEMAVLVHRELRKHKIDLRLGARLLRVTDVPGSQLALEIEGAATPLNVDFAVVALGVRPRNELAKQAGLEIGKTGGIFVNDQMQTSDPDIYAVGDAVEVQNFLTREPALIALASPANRQGRIAADNALGRDSRYRGTLGTSVCKVFDLTAAATGLSAKALTKMGKRFESVTIHPAHHATYYPGAATMTLKLLFDPEDGLVLGAQIAGAEGVDKRIDVLSTAIQCGRKVTDLEQLELAYAPPYGSAKDPVNFAGFVAENVRDGLHRIMHAEDWIRSPGEAVLIDVRNASEFAAGSIPGARLIPLDELRERAESLPRDKPLVVHCHVGLRGYIAQRILSERGFDARNLEGGYRSWLMAAELNGIVKG